MKLLTAFIEEIKEDTTINKNIYMIFDIDKFIDKWKPGNPEDIVVMKKDLESVIEVIIKFTKKSILYNLEEINDILDERN